MRDHSIISDRGGSVPLFLTLGLQVVREELRSCLKSLALFNLDAVLALLCSSACFGVGHAEDVISLDASVDSTVPRDGLAQFGCLIAGSFHSVENAECVFVGLFMLSRSSLSLGGIESVLLSTSESLLLNDIISLV